MDTFSNAQETLRVVEKAQNQSHSYLKQLHIWLGVGSAGGAIVMLSFAAALDDPFAGLALLRYSLWCFLLGVVTAGASILFLSLRDAEFAEHVGSTHNRDELHKAARQKPMMVSSPKSIAEEANKSRDELIMRSKLADDKAQKAWGSVMKWKRLWVLCLLVSSFSFIAGFALPLLQI